jgi:hypothetical protein
MSTNENSLVIDDAYITTLEEDFEWARKGVIPSRDAHWQAEEIHDAANHLLNLLNAGGFTSEANTVWCLISDFAQVREAKEKEFIVERDVVNDWYQELVEARRKRAAANSKAASANN